MAPRRPQLRPPAPAAPAAPRVESAAPVATRAAPTEFPYEALKRDAPLEPPPPLGLPSEPPVVRPLQVYAFDASLGNDAGNVITIQVPYEKLRPGPVGRRVAVVDYDATRGCCYDPVDLDDPHLALRGGVSPSESDPHFHQQMVYAVASETLLRFEAALGRTLRVFTPRGEAPLMLYLYPHAAEVANAWSLSDGQLAFGYFKAQAGAVGRTAPGQTVFTCLSHDVIVHVATHAILEAMRPDLVVGVAPGLALDSAAFAEGFADLAALLLHFSHRDALLETIQRTAGAIYRSVLRADGEPLAGAAPAIQAEHPADNPLLSMAPGFGEALGRGGGLRGVLGTGADPRALERATEPHQRGAILTAALFDAYFEIYMRRSVDLFRIYRAGGGRVGGGDLPDALAERLAAEASRIAVVLFGITVRALDYCPAGGLALGDFLRACITADFEHAPVDDWEVRPALMRAFRARGIKPRGAPFYSEDALRWPRFDASALATPGPRLQGLPEPGADARRGNQEALRAFVEAGAAALGLRPGLPFDLYPLAVARGTGLDGRPQLTLSAQVVQPLPDRRRRRDEEAGERLGTTLVLDASGALRYAIAAGGGGENPGEGKGDGGGSAPQPSTRPSRKPARASR